MSVHKMNDDDFKELLKSFEGDSPTALYRAWQGYKRGAERLLKEQQDFLGQGKLVEAQEKSRGILQAERAAKAIEAIPKFQEYRKMMGG